MWKAKKGERIFNFGSHNFVANTKEMGPFLQKQRFHDLIMNFRPVIPDIFKNISGEIADKFVDKLMEGDLELIEPTQLDVHIIDVIYFERITIVSAVPTVLAKLVQAIAILKIGYQRESNEYMVIIFRSLNFKIESKVNF